MLGTRPQDLVFTLFGEYLLHRREPVWVGSLIALMKPLGLGEGAVRTVLSRMARKGWFSTVRDGRKSFYDLTPRGRELLEAGEARIHHPPSDGPWDGDWLLLAYSIPEDRRQVRDRLRDRLAWLGFGSLGNGLWLSPHDVEADVRAAAVEMGIEDHVECFSARGAAFTDAPRLVGRCWDLPEINRLYEEFIDRHVADFRRCRQGLDEGEVSDEECFVLRFGLIHEYRGFPLEDPFLPRSLLPRDWAGECAAVLFQTYRDLLAGPADRYVSDVLGAAPGSPATSAGEAGSAGSGETHTHTGQR